MNTNEIKWDEFSGNCVPHARNSLFWKDAAPLLSHAKRNGNGSEKHYEFLLQKLQQDRKLPNLDEVADYLASEYCEVSAGDAVAPGIRN